MTKPTMFIVDDDPGISEIVVEVAKRAGYEPRTFGNAATFLDAVSAALPDVIVLDLVMPDMSGLEVILALTKMKSKAGLILISGYDANSLRSAEIAANDLGLDVVGALTKPMRLDDLTKTVQQAKRNIEKPTVPASGLKILVVDDESDIGEFVCDVADMMGFTATAVENAADFKARYCDDFDIVILDLAIPGTDGVELIRYLASRDCRAAIVLMSGFDMRLIHSAGQLAEAQGLRVIGTLNKPVHVASLKNVLGQVSAFGSASPTMPPTVLARPSAVRELPSEDEVRRAIAADELCVHYQPQLNLATGTPTGVEALVRWRHPTRGLLSPDLFVPTASATGLIDELTMRVLTCALTDMERWDRAGVSVDRISLNLEASSLCRLDFPERITDVLASQGVAMDRITIEITESEVIGELAEALEILTRLRMRKFGLSIDDFGTGHSTMRQLERYPFTELKIDKSFVQNLGRSPHSDAIVESMIDLAHRLGMSVVAEGVETINQLESLKRIECDSIQGYLISRPIPAEEIGNWVRKHEAEAPIAPRACNAWP